MSKPLVSIKCLVYNHEPYLRQCLDGFVMQKTNFPFEAIVHDDASTDRSADIIREYAEKYPDIIKPIYETENQWSKHDGSLAKIMDEACKGKYIALCEGDDYWTDPLKLHKQVDLLESHPEYSMTCSRARLYSERRKKIIGEIRTQIRDGKLSPNLVILRGGLYIATASVIYKKELRIDDYPAYCIKCHVGDYPLQIMGAMKGGIYYIDEPMVVYRVENPNSWVSRANNMEHDINTFHNRIKGLKSELEMLKGFSIDFPQYKKIFYDRINFFINSHLYRGMSKEYYKIYRNELNNFINQRNLLWKMDAFIRARSPHFVYAIYRRVATRIYLRR